jgi:hypothetical protein
VEELCPGFTQALVDHPAVECVITREGDVLVVQGRGGTAHLRVIAPEGGGAVAERGGAEAGEGASPVLRVVGQSPFQVYEEPEVVARQVASFASMDECGDVICFGASFKPGSLRDTTPGASGESHVYSFENQLGTHASAGGDQAYPFLMLHHSVPFDPAPIIEASGLFPFLRAYVQRGQRPPTESPRAHPDGTPSGTRSGTGKPAGAGKEVLGAASGAQAPVTIDRR